jgi:hypothetical protein
MKKFEKLAASDRAGAVGLATTAELVEWYNANSSSPVKKFADRKTAERRVLALLAEGVSAPVPEPKKVKAAKVNSAPADMSAAVAATWLNPDIAAARSVRDHVTVDGKWFVSVRQAFIDLNLPLNEHIKFRKSLKRARKCSGYGFTWAITALGAP